ncbi:MAG: PAS domain S-box protein, partial [Planctomycetota bacterium]
MATAQRAGDQGLDADTERDRQVLEACGTLAIVGLPALVVFAAYNALTLPRALAAPIVIHYGALAALFWIVGRLARRERFIRYGHALAALLGAGVFSVALHVLRARHDPYQTIYAVLVFVALGCVMLSVRWTIGTVAALTVAWLAGSRGSVGQARWHEMGITLCGAGTIAVALTVARGSALRRLAELARTDRQRRRQLERTLEAAEKEIRERARAERRYAQLVDDVEGIVWEADARLDRFHFVSRHAERVLGFASAEWIDQVGLFRSRLHPEDEPRCTAVAAAVVAGRHEPGVVECRLRRRDGETAWLRILMRRAAVEGGGLRLRGLMVDLT